MSSKFDVYNPHLLEPELHVIGEIAGGSGFDSDNSFCTFEVKRGKEWLLVGGEEKGQSQVDYPEEDDVFVWNHPIDLHYYTKTLQGWPKLILEVWKLDAYSQKHIFGYGFCFVPSKPASHELDVPIWRPCGTSREEVYDFFVGGVPHLVSKDLIHNTTTAKDERCRLMTKNVGTVNLQLEIVLRNMKPHQVSTK